MINRHGPAGTLAALRASPAGTMPVGMGAMLAQPGGSPLGLVSDGQPAPVHGGVVIDAKLMDLDRRVAALEQTEAGETGGPA